MKEALFAVVLAAVVRIKRHSSCREMLSSVMRSGLNVKGQGTEGTNRAQARIFADSLFPKKNPREHSIYGSLVFAEHTESNRWALVPAGLVPNRRLWTDGLGCWRQSDRWGTIKVVGGTMAWRMVLRGLLGCSRSKSSVPRSFTHNDMV